MCILLINLHDVNTFSSAKEAAEYFNCRHKTIMKYVKNNPGARPLFYNVCPADPLQFCIIQNILKRKWRGPGINK
jgi:hypothetical protein